MPKKGISERIRLGRQQNGLTQAELAEKLGVSQATVSNWEIAKQEPDAAQVRKLESIIGAFYGAKNSGSISGGESLVAEWLSKARQRRGMTVPELAQKAGVSLPTIYNIEAGRAENPRRRTLNLLEEVLGEKLGEAQLLKEASEIKGLGEFADFDPHDEKDWPADPGVYVFYDISQRPIYVGQGKSIANRIKNHQDKFWFKRPIVESGSYIPIKDEQLRDQVESVLIKFLKSNAVINKQQVERE